MHTYPVFMNITLSLDEGVVKRARKVARAMGKSLNQLIREHLERLTASADADAEIEELQRLSKAGGGRSRGWRFDRDQVHARS